MIELVGTLDHSGLHGRNIRVAWAECTRGDWMLRLAIDAGVDQRMIVRAAGTCAHLALSAVPADELRPLRCLRVLEAWVDGNADSGAVLGAWYDVEVVLPWRAPRPWSGRTLFERNLRAPRVLPAARGLPPAIRTTPLALPHGLSLPASFAA